MTSTSLQTPIWNRSRTVGRRAAVSLQPVRPFAERDAHRPASSSCSSQVRGHLLRWGAPLQLLHRAAGKEAQTPVARVVFAPHVPVQRHGVRGALPDVAVDETDAVNGAGGLGGQAVLGHPRRHDGDRVEGNPARGDEIEDLDPLGCAKAIDRQAGALERPRPLADQDGGREAVDAGLPNDGVDDLGAAPADEETARLLRDPPRHVALDPLPWRGFELRLDCGDALVGDPRRRRVGVGIHPVGTRQDPLERGVPADQRLTRLLGNADGGVAKPEPDLVRRRPDVLLRAEHDEDIVVRAGARALADAVEHEVAVLELRELRAGEHDRHVVEARDHADPSRQLVQEGRVGLRRELRQPLDAVDPHGQHVAARLQRPPDEADVDAGPDVGDVEGLDADRVRRGQAAAMQLVAQPEQVVLADALVVHEPDGEACARHSLDLDAAAAANRHVHVLTAGADARPDAAGGPRGQAAQQDRVAHLLGRPQLRPGHGLGERHAQAIGAPHDAVALVRHLAARVLLDAHVGHREPPALERQPAVDADDRRALEARGNRAVEVLLPGDVHLVDDVHVHHQAQLDRHVDGLLVHQERRRVVHLVRADVEVVQEVDDLLLRLELHERRAVVLAELGERGPHVAEHLAVVVFGVEAGGAAAEQLVRGQELLVHLEAGYEADRFVVERLDHRTDTIAHAPKVSGFVSGKA